MSSRSVAWVNNLSPDVDNANTGYNAVHRVHQHINTMSLLRLANHLSASPGRLLGGSLPLVIMLSSDLVTCRTPIVSGIASVISVNILD